MYELMRTGRSALLGAMESESGWGAQHLEPLRQPIAALQTIRRCELGVAALQDAREAGAFGRRPLFLWTKYPQDRETTKRLALQLNDADALKAWKFS